MSDENNIDGDLQDLLSQLDDQDEFLSTAEELSGTPELESPVVEQDLEEAELLDALDAIESQEEPEESEEAAKKAEVLNRKVITGDEVALRPIEELAPTDARVLDEFAITPKAAKPIVDQAAIDAKKYMDQMDVVAKEVLQACQADRQETQDVIKMLRQEIDKAHNASTTPSRMYVDGLVKAVEVKSNINATAVQIMAGVTKMLAATKAGTNIQNNNLYVDGSELEEILSKEVHDDLGDD